MRACNSCTCTVFLAALVSLQALTSSEASSAFLPRTVVSVMAIRGGSTRVLDGFDEEDNEISGEEEEDPEIAKRREVVRKYRMEQQMLMQLRSTILSEALANRGLSMTTLLDVSTADGNKPPEKIDWDCAMSTEEEPKSCLYSFDAEPGTKVIAPLGTTQWISLSALNRLRRTDPSKVEPMWHSQYAVLRSWFGDDSEYSALQHSGPRGLVLSLLLDQGIVLKALLSTVIVLASIIFLPFIDFFIGRALVSSTVWMNWPQWARIVHAALPLKLLLGQMAWKFMAKMFGKVEQRVKDTLVEMECATLEETIPLTVGPGSEVILEDVEDDVYFGGSFDIDDVSEGTDDGMVFNSDPYDELDLDEDSDF